MLRIRIDGGALTSEQLAVIGEISTTYGRGVADVTDRQNVQLHWIRVEDVPAIWEKLEAVGLSTTEACGDTPRVMLACPLEGVAADSVLDAGPALRETVERYLGDPAFSNLPRKFKTSISGCSRHCTNHEINDVAFVGVVGPDGTPGFDVWVGGGLSTNPMFAQRLGIFVAPAEVTEVWAGIASVFRDYGYRRSRNHARIKFLIADWGTEKFREVLEQEYLGRTLPDGPAPPGFSPAPRSCGHRAAERRSLQRRRHHPGRPHVRRESDRTGRVGSAPGRWTGPHDRAAGPGRPRCSRGQHRNARQRAGGDRPGGPAVGVPPRHDRLHRHRVLQAGDRRDQGTGRVDPPRSRTAAARLRHPDHDQREWLPELVRPLPGRRHRLQGHRAEGRRRRRCRGLPDPPRRAARHRSRVRPQVPRPEGHRGRSRRLRRADPRRLSGTTHRWRVVRDVRCPGRRGVAASKPPA